LYLAPHAYAADVEVAVAIDPARPLGSVARNMMCLTPSKFYIEDKLIPFSVADIGQAIGETISIKTTNNMTALKADIVDISAKLCFKTAGFEKLHLGKHSNPAGFIALTMRWSRGGDPSTNFQTVAKSLQDNQRSLTVVDMLMDAVRQNTKMLCTMSTSANKNFSDISCSDHR
jgi:hypothetical protein